MRMISRLVVLATLLASPSLAFAQASMIPDSIVIERTLCFGICPAYRLTITRAGEVHFESRNPGDSGRTASSRISPESVHALATDALIAGLFELPDTIKRDKQLCPELATDHPTVTVTIWRPTMVKRVVDYRGCYAASNHSVIDRVARLRRLETEIDSIAGSSRWVRPARHR